MLHLIERPDLVQRLAGKTVPVLVEALPQGYFDAGHLPGARHLPHTSTNQEIEAVLPDPDQAVVVYCASETCRNSDQLAQRLEQLGYTSVAVYRGGKADWEQAGLPLQN